MDTFTLPPRITGQQGSFPIVEFDRKSYVARAVYGECWLDTPDGSIDSGDLPEPVVALLNKLIDQEIERDAAAVHAARISAENARKLRLKREAAELGCSVDSLVLADALDRITQKLHLIDMRLAEIAPL